VVDAVRRGLDEQDVRLRGDGVGPLDVQGDLQGPAGVRGRVGSPARLVDLGEDRVGQAEGLVEVVQVAGDVRVVIGVHDGDRLALAVGDDGPDGGVDANVIHAIRVADLSRRQTADGAV